MGQKYGLIYEPEIKSIPITKSLKHIVMGSDGLFDQIPPAEMASLIHNKSGRGTCRTVAETAHSRWIGYADDVSAVLLYLWFSIIPSFDDELMRCILTIKGI